MAPCHKGRPRNNRKRARGEERGGRTRPDKAYYGKDEKRRRACVRMRGRERQRMNKGPEFGPDVCLVVFAFPLCCCPLPVLSGDGSRGPAAVFLLPSAGQARAMLPLLITVSCRFCSFPLAANPPRTSVFLVECFPLSRGSATLVGPRWMRACPSGCFQMSRSSIN